MLRATPSPPSNQQGVKLDASTPKPDIAPPSQNPYLFKPRLTITTPDANVEIRTPEVLLKTPLVGGGQGRPPLIGGDVKPKPFSAFSTAAFGLACFAVGVIFHAMFFH